VKSRPTANPTNRFHSVGVTYEDGDAPPPSTMTLIDDKSRSIIATNDSPDIGFRWSVNPYRGCSHACAYCLSGDTPILLGDGRTRRLDELAVGDEIYGTRREGDYRRYRRTKVLAHWNTRKPAFRIRLADRTELVASGDHRFLTEHGWKFVMPNAPPFQRPFLALGDAMLGTGARRASATRELGGIANRDVVRSDAAGLAELASEPRRFRVRRSSVIRERELDGQAIRTERDLRIVSIDALGERDLFDITTGTGDFIANGIISHNCFARPSHEYLDFGAGTDFDTKIVVKRDAPALLREAFDKPSWRGELVMFSGVTDCYQAAEAELQLTRQCLEVCLEYRNPVSIITKSALIERDVDLLAALAREAGCHVAVSLTWVDAELARAMEPWVPSPERRLKVIERLAAAGVPVGVMCGPIIPGLNDDQLVRVLERAHAAGAQYAGWVLLRLPGAVATVFEERVRAAFPLAADKILHRIRETRGGDKLYDPRFHVRGRGEGPYAQTIAAMFDATVKRLGLDKRDERFVQHGETRFRRPKGQLDLF
jgi:DNA repair photolyase